MPIKLVLDQGVPRDAASRLRALAYECVHVGEIGMSKVSDEDILGFALASHAVVVTLDADFHSILAVSLRWDHPSFAFASKVYAPRKLLNGSPRLYPLCQ